MRPRRGFGSTEIWELTVFQLGEGVSKLIQALLSLWVQSVAFIWFPSHALFAYTNVHMSGTSLLYDGVYF